MNVGMNLISLISLVGYNGCQRFGYLCPCRNRSTKVQLTTKIRYKMKSLIKTLKQAWYKYLVSCRAFFDRNYNLLFNSKNCVKIQFYEEWFKYNDIVTEGKTKTIYICFT